MKLKVGRAVNESDLDRIDIKIFLKSWSFSNKNFHGEGHCRVISQSEEGNRGRKKSQGAYPEKKKRERIRPILVDVV